MISHLPNLQSYTAILKYFHSHGVWEQFINLNQVSAQVLIQCVQEKWGIDVLTESKSRKVTTSKQLQAHDKACIKLSGPHEKSSWWDSIWPHTEQWFPSTLIIRELRFTVNATLMNRNDVNVTLMNKNDSPGLIKISHSSSTQDRKK